MRTVLRLTTSVVIGVLLLIPLGALYEAANLPVYHSWGLMHGSFTTAIPALVAASFVALGVISWFGKAEDVTPRLLACGSSLALVTTLFWVDQLSEYTVSIRHLGLYAALSVLFFLLCFRARRPFLVPLFLLIPLLIDPLFGLTMTGASGSIAMEIFGYDIFRKLLPAAVATGLGAALAVMVRSREA